MKAERELRFYTNSGAAVAAMNSGLTSFYTNVEVLKNNIRLRFGLDNDNNYGWIGTTSNNGCYFGAGSHATMFMDTNYRVYIGLNASEVGNVREELQNKYRLFVKQGVLAEDYGIAPISTWSDFVFNKDYYLKPLSEVEKFISINKHLPDVPSAKEVSEKGYSQHEINKALLQKVEELTLYVIEQQKKIEALEAQATK